MLKTKIFEEKAKFPVKKLFWPFFPGNIECEKPQATICEGSKGILTYTVEVIKSFLQELTRLLKTFEKKGKISSEKNLSAYLFSQHRVWKPQKTFHEVPEGIFTGTLEVIRSFLWDLRQCWKQKNLKKRQHFQWTKLFGLPFLALSSLKNVEGRFINVHKVFWQLLWKLQDLFCNT